MSLRRAAALMLVISACPAGSTVMPLWHAPAPAARVGAPEALPAQEEGATRPVSSPAAKAQTDMASRHSPPADDEAMPADVERRTDFRGLRLAGPFPATVTAVIDGDTFEAKVTIWLGHEVTTRVRLLGIDAAEMGSECAEERDMAATSREALRRMLGRQVDLSAVRFDKYGGRVLARARSAQYGDVSAAMLAGGYAIHYEGGRRQAWCEPVLTSRK